MIDDNDKGYLYSEYSDVYKEKYGIRPRWVSPSELSVEQLKQMLDELHNEPGNGWDDDFDALPLNYKGNESYYNDMQAKNNDDAEINNLANLGSEEGEEVHGFAGMGKGRHGRNKIHEEKPAHDYEECGVCGYDHEYDFPHLSDETMKKIKKLHSDVVYQSKKNKGELKENTMSNKTTIGQLRQIIREELLKVKK